MKKMFLILAFLFLMLFTYSFKPVFYDMYGLKNVVFSEIKYSLFCLDAPKNLIDCNIINAGNGFIVNTNITNAKKVKENITNVLGESASFKSSINKIDKILSFYNVEVIKTEKVDEILSIYGYSKNSNLNQAIDIDGQVVNIQIAFANNILTIGSPIILGDY